MAKAVPALANARRSNYFDSNFMIFEMTSRKKGDPL
jgi:hypothetical protein